MSIVQKAAWIIERNSGRNLSLAQIAEDCGVSRTHLAHAFSASTGNSVIGYLRGRRLSTAAATLAAGAPDIISVALDAGYSSHEAFNRAFRDQFGLTPEAVRERQSVDGLVLTPAIDTDQFTARRIAAPRIVEEQLIRVVGMVGRFPAGPGTNGIPQLWQRFAPFMAAIPAKKEAMPVGITRSAGADCGFDYIAGLEVVRFGDIPPELEALEIPARSYAVFSHDDHIAKIPETYRSIWDETLAATGRRAADAPQMERHKHRFDPRTGEGGVEIWIPLENI